jgi:hypothetical protein
MKIAVWLLVPVLWYTAAVAQSDSLPRRTSQRHGLYPVQVGVGLFSAFYSGDLTQKNALQGFGPGMDISFKFDTPRRVSPIFNLGFGSFAAENRDLPLAQGIQPNTFVQTAFWYVDLMLRINLVNRSNPKRMYKTKSVYAGEPRLRPYAAFGLGILGFTPRDRNGNNLATNPGTRAPGENYGNTTAFFPLAIGVTYRLSPVIMVGAELQRRFTFTQYLDNIGQLGAGGADALNTLQLSVHFTPKPMQP